MLEYTIIISHKKNGGSLEFVMVCEELIQFGSYSYLTPYS